MPHSVTRFFCNWEYFAAANPLERLLKQAQGGVANGALAGSAPARSDAAARGRDATAHEARRHAHRSADARAAVVDANDEHHAAGIAVG